MSAAEPSVLDLIDDMICQVTDAELLLVVAQEKLERRNNEADRHVYDIDHVDQLVTMVVHRLDTLSAFLKRTDRLATAQDEATRTLMAQAEQLVRIVGAPSQR